MFKIEKDTERAVFEMGMDRPGDILKLTEAVCPAAAIVTQIGVSHIEFLKTKENILNEKLDVVKGMRGDGVLVINGDDSLLRAARKNLPVISVTYATENTEADVVARDIMTRANSSEFTIFDRINGAFFAAIPAVGEHNIMNALAAYTLATRIGLDPKRSADALQNYVPAGMRQNVVEYKGITVIEDCYNANPDSMRAALQALFAIPSDGIRVAVLGDMLELGGISEEEHQKLGIEAAKYGVDVLLCYGEMMRHAAASAKAAGIACVETFDRKEDVADYLIKTLHEKDAVVFKGSRGMKMEEILGAFYVGYGK
jgi:UDP-N-acetylmuramoyl-tripeptide--D-alanyl-D-alanine ligase